MKQKHYIGFITLVTATLLAACVHDYPTMTPDGEEGIDPTLVVVDTEVTFDLDLKPFESITNKTRSGATEAATGDHRRRFIIEARRAGQAKVRQVAVMEDAEETGKTLTLPVRLRLHAVEYSLAVWTDYVQAGTDTDLHYNTGDLNGVGLNEPYAGNTDYRDCHYATVPLDLRPYRDQWNARVRLDVDMVRPLAKYRIVATDVEQYKRLIHSKGYPPLDELSATVLYEGFLPNSFNVTTGSPNDATTGLSYEGILPDMAAGDSHVQLGSDLILANGAETFTNVTVRITDSAGNTVSRVSGVRIPYRRGHLTTITGKFLTAGTAGGNIHIDTEWEDDIIIKF